MKRLVSLLFRIVMKFPGADQALRTYVIENDGGPIREALWGENAEPDLQDTLFGQDHCELRTWLEADNFALLRDVAARNGAAGLSTLLEHTDTDLLRAILNANGGFLERFLRLVTADDLKALLFSDDLALFRKLALSNDSTPIRHLLFADNYRILRELLSRRGHEALKAVVLNGSDEIFPMLVIARRGKPLADLLFADDARLLCDLCRIRKENEVLPLFEAEKTRFLSFLDSNDAISILECHLTKFNFAESILQSRPLFDSLRNSERWNACIALSETWRSLAPLFSENSSNTDSPFRAALQRIQEPAHVRGRILDVITEGDVVHLAHGSLRFPCRHSLWTLLHEILLHEGYFFSCGTDAPRIIDGGTHMGMAIYYFKALYPKARITGFEPLPFLRDMALENITRNKYHDVSILPYALSEKAGEAPFHVSDSWTMAGSLQDRRSQLGDDIRQITVKCVPLSNYLDEPVHFLKLDIEGSEAEVLTEAAEKLSNVQHLFCEFHQGAGLGSDRLTKILRVLEGADFEVQVGKSHNYQQTSLKQPFTHFGGAASMLIWARNRNWDDHR